MISGLLLGLGLLLKVGVGLYSWYSNEMQDVPVGLLAINLLGLLGSGLLMRWGLQMRRGSSAAPNPDRNEIL